MSCRKLPTQQFLNVCPRKLGRLYGLEEVKGLLLSDDQSPPGQAYLRVWGTAGAGPTENTPTPTHGHEFHFHDALPSGSLWSRGGGGGVQ